jgi:hypothetical protein
MSECGVTSFLNTVHPSTYVVRMTEVLLYNNTPGKQEVGKWIRHSEKKKSFNFDEESPWESKCKPISLLEEHRNSGTIIEDRRSPTFSQTCVHSCSRSHCMLGSVSMSWHTWVLLLADFQFKFSKVFACGMGFLQGRVQLQCGRWLQTLWTYRTGYETSATYSISGSFPL